VLEVMLTIRKALHLCTVGRDQISKAHLRPHARQQSPACCSRDRHPHIDPRVDYEKLSSDRLGERSASIRERQHVCFEGSDIICPMREPGLSSRAGNGITTTQTCAWQKYESSVNWMKRGIAW
jgi:hypothetical protein